MGLLILAGFVGFIALGIWLVVLGARRARALRVEWEELVARVGATVVGRPSYPCCQLELRSDGFLVELHQWTETRGSGDDERTYTFCEMRLRLSRPGLATIQLAPEGLLSKVGKFFGMTDVEIGDAEFDAAFVTKAPSAQHVRDLLDPSMRRALVAARWAYDQISLQEGALVWRGSLYDHPAEAMARVDELAALARVLA